MKNTIKKTLTCGAVACGLVLGGWAGMPSADACGPYMSPQELAQMGVDWSEREVETVSAKLDAAVEADDAEAIARYARGVSDARARLKEARLRLRRFDLKRADARVAKRDIKRVDVPR